LKIKQGESHESQGQDGNRIVLRRSTRNHLCYRMQSLRGAQVERHLLPAHDAGRERAGSGTSHRLRRPAVQCEL